MQLPTAWRVAIKLGFGCLGLSALITEIVVLHARGTLNPGNFFSFFTIENNLLLAVTFLLSAVYTGRHRAPRRLDRLRGAAAVYIVLVGVGFVVLLSGLQDTAFTAIPWDNTVLHYIMPLAAVFDLIIDRPHSGLRFKPSLAWLLYPVAYVAYTLLRGPLVSWYPYPFLNPHQAGYAGIALAGLGLLVLGVILIALVCRWSTAIPVHTDKQPR